MAIRQPSPPNVKPPTRPKWQSRYHGVRMTPEQYLQLPEEKPYLEYIDGMVVQKPMPNEEHAQIALEVGYHIRLWLRGKKGRAGVEARAKLGELPNYRLPDVSFWKAGVPAGNQAPPTLAVEILSPGQSLAELRRKCEFLRSTGVETCWLIDPEQRTAELFEGRTKKGRAVDVLTADCLADFALPLTELFSVLGGE
ncbi:MAG: Uma2 family endonuclease [Dehalococcoidia bacterium]